MTPTDTARALVERWCRSWGMHTNCSRDDLDSLARSLTALLTQRDAEVVAWQGQAADAAGVIERLDAEVARVQRELDRSPCMQHNAMLTEIDDVKAELHEARALAWETARGAEHSEHWWQAMLTGLAVGNLDAAGWVARAERAEAELHALGKEPT